MCAKTGFGEVQIESRLVSSVASDLAHHGAVAIESEENVLGVGAERYTECC